MAILPILTYTAVIEFTIVMAIQMISVTTFQLALNRAVVMRIVFFFFNLFIVFYICTVEFGLIKYYICHLLALIGLNISGVIALYMYNRILLSKKDDAA
jgi:hypothetical protein